MSQERFKRCLTDVYGKTKPKGFYSPNHYAADYSIAKDGMLVALRWNRGEAISPDPFVSVA